MRKFLFNNIDILVLAALMGIPLLLYLTAGHKGRKLNFADRAVLAVAAPIQRLMTNAQESAATGVSTYVALQGANEKAVTCERELATTRTELNAATEAIAENRRLRGILGLADAQPGKHLVARVIGLNPATVHSALRIDRGSGEGILVGMAVLSATGVLGQVIRATDKSADVMVATDPTSRVGGLIQRSRVRCSVSGAGGGHPLRLDLVRRDEDVLAGDRVVTSGTDGVFPKGLLIGTVVEISRTNGGSYLSGTITPAVDVERTEEVVVLTSPSDISDPRIPDAKGVAP